MTLLDDILDTQLCPGRSTSLYSCGMGTSMPMPSSGMMLQLGPNKILSFSLTNCALPDDMLHHPEVGVSPELLDTPPPRTIKLPLSGAVGTGVVSKDDERRGGDRSTREILSTVLVECAPSTGQELRQN